MTRGIVGRFTIAAILLSGCVAQVVDIAPTPQESRIEVFFTDPNAPGADSIHGGPDEDLEAAIDNARISIDIAIYDLNLYGIRDALVDAQDRGVQVRMVVESDNFEPGELAVFTMAGIPFAGDNDEDAMHNKFVVIDRYEVWTGSVNYTVSDVYDNRNNLLRLYSTELAENYLVEFEEMFSNGMFGAYSPAETPNRQLDIGGSIVETFFAPEDGVEARLVELVNEANESIYLLAYSFTSDALAEALIAAQRRGVIIRGVMDAAQIANAGGEFDRLTVSGIDLRVDGEDGSMHHKVLIIDNEIVVTGSYNFSANAELRNDENLLVIHNLTVASKYMEEFSRLWELSSP